MTQYLTPGAGLFDATSSGQFLLPGAGVFDAPSSGVSVSATTDALVLAESAAIVRIDVAVTGTTDALALAEVAATVSIDVAVAGTTDALVLAESAAVVSVDVAVAGSTDALVLTEYPATVVTDEASRPASDITTTGWTASTGSDLYAMLDETVADDGDYIISPLVSVGPGPAVFALSSALAAGNYAISVRAKRTEGVGQIRALLLDSGGSTVGTTSWQALLDSFADYELAVEATGTAARVRLEVTE